jgi:galactosamine-6-phosphate isomerase
LNHEDMSRRAAARVLSLVRRTPDLLLGVATGATPARTYERLAARAPAGSRFFRRLRVLGLDEWLGLPAGHPATCAHYIRERILAPLRIPHSRFQGFRPASTRPATEALRLSRWLDRHGPIDVCLLGLGRNGHLLMNEPADELQPRAHVAVLAESTRRHSMLTGVRVPPRRGLTFGMAEVLQSRSILLLVSGRHKRRALARVLEGTVSSSCPASYLWLHPDVTILCDRSAAPGAGRRPGRRARTLARRRGR